MCLDEGKCIESPNEDHGDNSLKEINDGKTPHDSVESMWSVDLLQIKCGQQRQQAKGRR